MRFLPARTLMALVALLALLLPGPALWAEEAESSAGQPPGISPAYIKDLLGLSVYVQGGYTWNFNGQKENQLRVFDTEANSFTLDLAQVIFARQAAVGGLGYMVKISAGETAKLIHSAGLGDLGDDAFDLTDAYLTYVAPVGNGLELSFGKFETWIGAEVIDAAGDWNYSRSYLFGFAVPFTHTGLKVSYPFTDMVRVSAFAVNGWDKSTDNNKDKSYGAQLSTTPLPGLCLTFNFLGGPEEDDNNHSQRYLYDAVATYGPPMVVGLSLMVNYDYGYEENNNNAEIPGTSPAIWQGVAGYARYQFLSWLAAALRGEWFQDRNGFRTGLGQEVTLYEVTFTPEIEIRERLLLRPEYRHDWASEEVFQDGDGAFTEKSQDTIAVGLMYTW
jgi:hypothetical protein